MLRLDVTGPYPLKVLVLWIMALSLSTLGVVLSTVALVDRQRRR